jgi:putative ABC transport system permease protein
MMGLFNLARRRRTRLESELERELAYHLECRVHDLLAAGVSPEEARRQARFELGGVAQIQEEVRQVWLGRGVDALARGLADLRLAGRMLGKHPRTTMVAVTALALGIGFTSTMFSIVDGVLFRGVPYPAADQIQHVGVVSRGQPREVPMRMHAYRELVERQTFFEALAGSSFFTANVVGPDGLPERYPGVLVTANLFSLLRVAPVLGPGFAGDAGAAKPQVAISGRVWRERFAAAPDVIGRTMRVNGTAMAVIGVMPERFGISDGEDVWVAVAVDPSASPEAGPLLQVVGRLRPGVTSGQAALQMNTLWHQLAREHPRLYGDHTIDVKPLARWMLGAEAPRVLIPILLAVFGVLLVACANVANLVLVGVVHRARELAVRTALGATRVRIARQILVEVLLLALGGALGGLVLAQVGITLFSRAVADKMPPRMMDIRIDGAVVVFVVAMTVICALAAGLVPALRASQLQPMDVIKDGDPGSSVRVGRISKALVIAEIAVSFALLVVSALVSQSAWKRARADFGFDGKVVWSARLELPSSGDDRDVTWPLLAGLLDRLETLPGVTSASAATALPIHGSLAAVVLAGSDLAVEPTPAQSVRISPGYFRTLGVATREGREFDALDASTSLPVAIVNESFARAHFPIGALGRTLALANDTARQWRTIVGVVPDLGMGRTADDPIKEGIYLPLAQVPAPGVTVLLRATGAPLELTQRAREALRALDPDLPMADVRTVAETVASGAWPYRLFGTFLLASGIGALFLAMVGLYGVMAFSVNRRTREIGVRMALGAQPGAVLRLVLRQGLGQITAGMLIGGVLATLLGTALRLLLFDVTPLDLRTWAVIAGALALTAMAACFVPARRAAWLDPMVALRRA